MTSGNVLPSSGSAANGWWTRSITPRIRHRLRAQIVGHETWPASQKSILKSLIPIRSRCVKNLSPRAGYRPQNARRESSVPGGHGYSRRRGRHPGHQPAPRTPALCSSRIHPSRGLQTATLNPAMFYNKLADFGPVQKGRIADLVLLRADPLDIRNTRRSRRHRRRPLYLTTRPRPAPSQTQTARSRQIVHQP